MPFEFCRQTYRAKSLGIGILFSENCVILASVVLSQYTRVTDDDIYGIWMTHYVNDRTLQCNGRLKRVLGTKLNANISHKNSWEYLLCMQLF